MTWREVHRLAAVVLCVAVGALTPAIVTRIAEDVGATPWWWDTALAVSLALSFGALARCITGHQDPRPWAALLVTTVAGGLLTFPIVAGEPLAHGSLPWIALLTPTAAGALGVAAGWRAAVATCLVLAAIQWWAQGTAMWPASDYRRSADLIFILVCVTAVSAVMEALRSRALSLAAAEERTIAAAAHATRQALEEREGSRWDALVHDEVLAVLDAARSGFTPASTIRLMAHNAITAFQRPPTSDRIPARTLRDGLAATCGQADDAVEFAVSADGSSLPGPVADALEAATMEALRNARRHAAVATTRSAQSIAISVTGRISVTDTAIHVCDDGRGFDPDRIAIGRMGISVSIVGRMRAVRGVAAVASRPGHGTLVTLRWPEGRE